MTVHSPASVEHGPHFNVGTAVVVVVDVVVDVVTTSAVGGSSVEQAVTRMASTITIARRALIGSQSR